ncbi:SPL family radical SAM protein [Chengkuizengella axinellae]|uniref:Radical SAM protein n=1 Tax=Chengkuizengella axinellae TaxID=3064388 RepID=A0ABT9J665_9BACL|nr:radical SAM protein [Chengkuizengella sp. 2205SS18-9]MDP5277099.1 radical SAM protein [Chengkuizengella sp. 2205SS18-9]
MEIHIKEPKQILTKASGYLKGYTHTLNSYAGCSFSCKYCYVREMPISKFRQSKAGWGTWVDVKKGASNLLKKELVKAKQKGPVYIFMSSSTDPYQPVEAKHFITRSLLEVMVDIQPDFLFVQTRSPLVTRDIDLFNQLKPRLLISMTIETDREKMRKIFTPKAPPIAGRFKALQELKEVGLPTQVAISPVLPSSDSFAEKLSSVVDRICIDDYFMGDGSEGKRTKRLGIQEIYEKENLHEWYDPSAYLRVKKGLEKHYTEDQIFVSQDGFLPITSHNHENGIFPENNKKKEREEKLFLHASFQDANR